MVLHIIGEHPLAKGENGKLKSRIGTLFPGAKTLVTLPGIHATQRMAYVEALNRTRHQRGEAPLGWAEESTVWQRAVDLIVEDDALLIRPDPDRMPLAFAADEILQALVPKHKIRFLHVLNEKVRQAIKQRGECWRINPLPKSVKEMRRMIADSRIGINGREIYYYNKASGTRLLTFRGFAQLATLDDDELRNHLSEIQDFSNQINAQANPEIDFFMAKSSFSKKNFREHDFHAADSDAIRATYQEFTRQFRDAVPPEYRWDDRHNEAWCNHMFASLIGQEGEVISEEMLLGLSPEFFMRIQWLPGGRIENGELIYDSMFEQAAAGGNSELEELCDENSQGFIFNLVRQFGDLDYVNVGRVKESLSHRPDAGEGRRNVYLVEFKTRHDPDEIVRIIRMQKWGVREHLDERMDLADAIVHSDEYTEYVLDRQLACRQLGMHLPANTIARKIREKYSGIQSDLEGTEIRSPYFERDYIRGIATDKIPDHRFENEQFAFEFARLMGSAAAINLIVGRCSRDDNILFDDGDEVLVENDQNMPVAIVVADQTGNLVDYHRDLASMAPDYAAPINRRLEKVADAHRFADVYLDAFLQRFRSIQNDYRQRRGAFETLFQHRPRDENGSVAFRWERVLERLDRSDPKALEQLIRENVAR